MAGIKAEGRGFGLGGPGLVDPNLAPVGNLVKSIKMVGFPQFVFEYHPSAGEDGGKVYVVEAKAARNEKGEIPAAVLAEHVYNEGQAYGFVQTFLRGYRRGARGEVVAAVS